jgi:LuxR family maltose regulon positive regulatory protein
VALDRPAEAIGLLRTLEGRDNIAAELVRNHALAAAGVQEAACTPSERAIAQAPLAVQVEGLIGLAELALGDRDPARAEELLERALRIASTEHLRRPFKEASDDVRAFLETSGLTGRNRWLGATGATEAADRAAGLVPLPPRGAHDGLHPSAIVIPLTPKESEVLGYLAELLTTEEIAATMYVSVNTIRSHVRSILRKLGVGRRNEAVRLAWELRLLPAPGPASTTIAQ